MEADSEQAVGSRERVRLETILRAAGCLPVREPVAGNKTHDSRLNIFFSTILNYSPFSTILDHSPPPTPRPRTFRGLYYFAQWIEVQFGFCTLPSFRP